MAERVLFKKVFLRRNVESHYRLRLIATHSRLSKYVKSVKYNMHTPTKYSASECPNMQDWFQYSIGNDWQYYEKSQDPAIEQFKSKLGPHQPVYHYTQYCDHLRRERLVDMNGLEDREMVQAFKLLPNLEDVGTYLHWVPMFLPTDTISSTHFSAIGQETLAEPSEDNVHNGCGKYLRALLKAASSAGTEIRRVTGNDLPKTFIHRPADACRALCDAVQHCYVLELDIGHVLELEVISGEEMAPTRNDTLASMIAQASQLRVLKVCFMFSVSYHPDDRLQMSKLLAHRAHWPYLHCLKLGGLVTSETAIKSFLGEHSFTLRSVELVDIGLTEPCADESANNSSWISLILFLRDQLASREVSLGGCLHSGRKENWQTSLCYDGCCGVKKMQLAAR